MRRTILFSLPMLLVACSSGGEDANGAAVAAYLDATEALHEVVDAHVQSVAGASDLDAITGMLDDYSEDFGHAMEDLEHAMDDVEGCEMGMESAGMVDENWDDMSGMGADVAAHIASHGDHEQVADCAAEAAAHESAMDERLDMLLEHGGHWRNDSELSCGSHDDGPMDSHDAEAEAHDN